MFIAALLTIVKGWEQSKCQTVDEGINRLWYIPTVEHYLALKRNKVLTYATMCEPQKRCAV